MQHKHTCSIEKFRHILIRLVNETRAIALVQASTQANQFARAIDRAGNIINFTEIHAGKSFIFCQDLKETCSLISVSLIRKGISGKHPICENNTYVCFH